MTAEHAPVWAAPLVVAAVLAVGCYLVAVTDLAAARLVAGRPVGGGLLAGPLRRAAIAVCQQRTSTERPDDVGWVLAPTVLAGVAAAGLSVVPLGAGSIVADLEAGIVLWGAVEALAIVALFLHGWSANSHQPLLAAYRVVPAGLAVLLLSMFVLIAAAVAAESLQVSRIVESQAHVWNAVRHPLSLPLFAVVALGVTSWGPLDIAEGADLSGGTSAEASGIQWIVWTGARASMLVSYSAMAAAAFLGGWNGPLLPGPAWMVIKASAVLVVLVSSRHLLARVRIERFVTVIWTVLLPLAFVDLAIAGLVAL